MTQLACLVRDRLPLRTALLLAAFLAMTQAVLAAGSFDIRDAAEFAKIVSPREVLKNLATVNGWIEGPVWQAVNGGRLIFSDQGNNKLYQWSAANGLRLFRQPNPATLQIYANGNTLDRHERLITCEGGGGARRVTLTEPDGTLRVLVDRYVGKAFNAPNDVTVKSDGTLWFTDPNYGAGQVQPGRYVFRCHPTNGNATVTAVVQDFVQPNGLCFSPDESLLYIADSDPSRHHIRVFTVTPQNTLSNGRTFCTLANGVPDGIRCDVDGRVYSSAKDGIHIFAPDGHLIGKILTPTTTANLCFGDADAQTLYIVAQPTLHSIRLLVPGAPPLRRLDSLREGDCLTLAWLAPCSQLQLQVSTQLGADADWQPVFDSPSVLNGSNLLTRTVNSAHQFYRLKNR